MEYIAIALAPGIAICLFIFYKDVYNREPRLNLFVSFFLGCFAILPAIWFENEFAYTIDGTITGVAIFSYAIVGFSEEASKFLGLRLYSYNKKSFDEPLDGIVYSVMVSMGFATLENVMYVLNYAQAGRGLEVGIQRMFLSVPAHASFAVVMGYFAGKAKFTTGSKSLLLMLTGLLMAIFFHGTYDFFLFLPKYSHIGKNLSEGLLAGGAIGSYIVCLVLSRKLIRYHRNISQDMFKNKNQNISV
ncbi:MAG: PrsW family intramembrane metalloprotease [Chitinophagaceae bacterium]|nr:PrsW family intramembrane metalloprotease [Chitinophagaceae bacterium]